MPKNLEELSELNENEYNLIEKQRKCTYSNYIFIMGAALHISSRTIKYIAPKYSRICDMILECSPYVMSMGIILALPSIFGLYIINIEEKPDNKKQQ